jgi:uncharacterized protein
MGLRTRLALAGHSVEDNLWEWETSVTNLANTTRRRRFLTAEWRWLVMINYEVDSEVLRPLVPQGVELDAWHGKHLVSMVGFRFLNTRLMGMPIPGHINFDEVNLRFYVRRELPEGPRRGVVFVKEIVPRRAIAFVARRLYDEPYVALPMRHQLSEQVQEQPRLAVYEWRHGGRWNNLSAWFQGEPSELREGSEEEFITEHYWGYTARRDGSTSEYRVEHPAWRVWRASTMNLSANVAELYGEGFVNALSKPPVSAFVAEGSPVSVYRGGKIA